MKAIEAIAVMLTFVLAYLCVPAFLFWRSGILAAGIGMLLIAVGPLLIERLHQGYGSDGDGILLLLTLPLPLVLIMLGIILFVVRMIRRSREASRS